MQMPAAAFRFSRDPDGDFSTMSMDPRFFENRTITGDAADYAVRTLLPAINRFGGNRQRVSEAVNLLEHTDPARYIRYVAHGEAAAHAGVLTDLPYSVRLALEMSTHEDAERRAMEGELAQLEEAWRIAEEIAGISDSLLTPESVASRMITLSRREPPASA
nr:Unknown Function [uncultured bacterium]